MVSKAIAGVTAALLAALGASACGEVAGGATDARQPDAAARADAAIVAPDAAPVDAGSGATPADAALPDAEASADAATAADATATLDAAAPGPDASAADAAEPGDASAPDSGSPADAAAQADSGASIDSGPNCTLCTTYSGASITGLLPADLTEASGLATSRAHAGVIYSHNDSGDTARFFAMDKKGNLLGEFVLPGATAVDWEDMAIGPCPTGTCVYLGDIGDNTQVRSDYALYRVPEPSVEVGQPVGSVSVTWERLPFEYPGAAKWNAETLLVHPQSADVYVINKVSPGTPSVVFKFPQPLTPGVSATLTQVATLPIPKIDDYQLTAGDIHPCGQAMLLRTYLRLYEFHLGTGQPFDSIFTTSDYGTVRVAIELQGEAVAYLPDGRGYVTTSEGKSQPINVYTCP